MEQTWSPHFCGTMTLNMHAMMILTTMALRTRNVEAICCVSSLQHAHAAQSLYSFSLRARNQPTRGFQRRRAPTTAPVAPHTPPPHPPTPAHSITPPSTPPHARLGAATDAARWTHAPPPSARRRRSEGMGWGVAGVVHRARGNTYSRFLTMDEICEPSRGGGGGWDRRGSEWQRYRRQRRRGRGRWSCAVSARNHFCAFPRVRAAGVHSTVLTC
jgi:hypothetical protein